MGQNLTQCCRERCVIDAAFGEDEEPMQVDYTRSSNLAALVPAIAVLPPPDNGTAVGEEDALESKLREPGAYGREALCLSEVTSLPGKRGLAGGCPCVPQGNGCLPPLVVSAGAEPGLQAPFVGNSPAAPSKVTRSLQRPLRMEQSLPQAPRRLHSRGDQVLPGSIHSIRREPISLSHGPVQPPVPQPPVQMATPWIVAHSRKISPTLLADWHQHDGPQEGGTKAGAKWGDAAYAPGRGRGGGEGPDRSVLQERMMSRVDRSSFQRMKLRDRSEDLADQDTFKYAMEDGDLLNEEE